MQTLHPQPPEDKLSPEEEEVCRKFHFDPEGYLAQRKQMQIVQAEDGPMLFFRYR